MNYVSLTLIWNSELGITRKSSNVVEDSFSINLLSDSIALFQFNSIFCIFFNLKNINNN